MQLGFVSAILPELTCAEVFSAAAEMGFDAVELMCWPVEKATRRYAGVTHINVAALTDQLVSEIQELSWKHGVRISGLGYYANPLSPDREEAEKAIEHVRRVLDACARLGVPCMNTFIGRNWHKPLEDNLDAFVGVWKPLVQHAEDLDIRIAIENCPMLFTRDEWPGGKNLAVSPAVWRRMFADIPSPHFGLNYDPSHMILQQMDEVQPLLDFAPRIFHIHAKDLIIDRAALNDLGIFAYPNSWSSGRLPGRGQVRWTEFFRALQTTGYRGSVCIEVEDRDYEGTLQGRKQALLESSQFLRQFIPKT